MLAILVSLAISSINSYSFKRLFRYLNISLASKLVSSVVSVLFKWTASQQVN
jgi:hypothetical protein